LHCVQLRAPIRPAYQHVAAGVGLLSVRLADSWARETLSDSRPVLYARSRGVTGGRSELLTHAFDSPESVSESESRRVSGKWNVRAGIRERLAPCARVWDQSRSIPPREQQPNRSSVEEARGGRPVSSSSCTYRHRRSDEERRDKASDFNKLLIIAPGALVITTRA